MTHPCHPLLVLDTNVFIEAHHHYYAHDLCPGFWECLLHYCRENRVRSIDRVRDEILAKPDELTEWVNQAPGNLFLSSAEKSIIEVFTEMRSWVKENCQFRPAAESEFANAADGWIAAYASVHNGIVITHEVFRKNVKRRVPLPNVCKEFNIDYQNPFEMLRELEVRFDWEPL